MNGRLTVLHVITRLELGGAQRNTLYTVGHLDRSLFRPALAWGPGDRLDAEVASLEDVELHPLEDLLREIRPAADVRALGALRRLMQRLNPDIVHTHSSKAGILGRLAAHIEQVPTVVHSIHGFGFTPLQPAPVRGLFLGLERLAARWTDHFIAVSEANVRTGVALGLFGSDAVSLIRSGIRLGEPGSPGEGARFRERLGVPDGVPLVTQVGNFKPQKAPLDFVRAAALIGAEVREAHFLMVGDGPLRSAVARRAARLGLGERLHLPGWVEDVRAVLSATAVAVLTSRFEGLPRAAVEAVAAGVPIVATAVDGTPEVVMDGVTGLLVEPGDVEGTANAVLRLLRDADLYRRIASAPRDLREFDIDTMVRQHEDLYRWLRGLNR